MFTIDHILWQINAEKQKFRGVDNLFSKQLITNLSCQFNAAPQEIIMIEK